MSKPKKNRRQKIAGLNELKDGQTKKFSLRRADRVTEAFLLRRGDDYHAYLNLCRHWMVGLDYDDNDFLTEDGRWVVCKSHGALYRSETGECESGPCNGAALYRVPVEKEGGAVWALLDQVDWGES
ncbi:MAG TPA: Rieske 2Fe-2S domain-containing protein [bacterium]|nr:Rieske 2Fe-2S domain-containing protein [bacterium]